ncbi:MAG: metallophosphoesterase, partial [Candidatus Geothermincolia bacterium]
MSSPARTAVLSDIHCGSGSPLEDAATVGSLLAEMRRREGAITRAVLLGDIWELWLARPEEALAASRLLLTALAGLEELTEVVFVCGNHDHAVYMWHREERFFEGLARGRPFPLFYDGSSARLAAVMGTEASVEVRLLYPFMEINCGGRRVLLTHGHHLDYFASSLWCFKTHWLARAVLAGRRDVSPEELESCNCAFFEMMAGAALSNDLRGRTKRFYGWMMRLAGLLGLRRGGASPGRLTAIEEYRLEIAAFLKMHGREPDLFVFGHTHLAGHTRIGGADGLDAVNIGCWKQGKGVERLNTYLILDDSTGAATLWQYGNPER